MDKEIEEEDICQGDETCKCKKCSEAKEEFWCGWSGWYDVEPIRGAF
jgi:hypothetical protein